jgi:3-phenylpropionate/cinnamic acid dioxygenase small subunit
MSTEAAGVEQYGADGSSDDYWARAEVEDFLFMEAELLDGHEYESWAELWATDGTYWVPANGEDPDPFKNPSFIFDNMHRLKVRIDQLLSGDRLAQLPVSRTQHFITNVRLRDQNEQSVTVLSGYCVVESRPGVQVIWAARGMHVLRRSSVGTIEMVKKVVTLINNDQPVPTLAVLL